ncbi:hypothetical protein EI983_09340 [Roseovarius faecimaris]|uniref:Uncharacterized protein n=1 Tax=Roseovarius faecimaris TaxID=2494550 RepID=A0A6I6IRG6_9RHOB|nr:hypothetical protein [Roseovarius faecimaris]QGX98473.1 hypothetical protein EI983_09340 [Roseovarius faecimaris]
MQVVLHAGAHITDEDRLVNTLIANRDMLGEFGTNVPHPTTYRKLIRDVFQTAQHTGLGTDVRDVILDTILKGDAMDRVILSNPGLFGTPKMAISAGSLYAATEQRLEILTGIFNHDALELYLAICNPATFLPAVYQKTPYTSFDEFMRHVDPRSVRWSDMLTRVREAFPDLPITVWCNEDLPLIWAQVLREMAGIDPTVEIEGEFALLNEIMTPAGLKRFDAYIASHPGMSEIQKRRVIAAFLDKFAKDEAIEEELDIPGWTEDLIDQLTEIYDEDLYAIQRIPGINLITP